MIKLAIEEGIDNGDGVEGNKGEGNGMVWAIQLVMHVEHCDSCI